MNYFETPLISQLDNKMCSQQARSQVFEQVVTLLLLHQVPTSFSVVVNLGIATCYVQTISDLLGQLVTSPLKLSSLLQDAKLFVLFLTNGCLTNLEQVVSIL